MKKLLFSFAVALLTAKAAMAVCYADVLNASLTAPAPFVNVSGTAGTSLNFFVGIFSASYPPDCNPSNVNFTMTLNLKNSAGTVVYSQVYYPSCGSYNTMIICDSALLCPYQHQYTFGIYPSVPFIATFNIPNQSCGQYMVEAVVSSTYGTNLPWSRNIRATNVGGGTTICPLNSGSCPLGNVMIVNFSGTGGLTATGTSTNTVCGGSTGSATISPSGGLAPYSYSWMGSTSTSATASSLAAGSYTATVTDANGCAYSRVFTIGNAPLSVTISPGSQTVCKDKCLTLTASVSPTGSYTYTWTQSINGGTPVTIGTGNPICVRPASVSRTSNTTNVYTVNVTNGAGCSGSASVTITVNPNCTVDYYNGCCSNGGGGGNRVAGDVENPVNAQLSISPNPAKDEVSIQFDLPASDGRIEIYTMDGKLVQRIDDIHDAGVMKISAEGMTPGVYMVCLISGDMRLRTEKLVIAE